MIWRLVVVVSWALLAVLWLAVTVALLVSAPKDQFGTTTTTSTSEP